MAGPRGYFFLFICLTLTGGPSARSEPPRAKGQPVAGEKKLGLLDQYGDPLPLGAVARLGSIRLRHAGMSDFVFLPGGKTVLSAGSDRVLRFWDLATGRQARAVTLQGKAGPGRAVTLSPDGKTLVADDGGMLVFWEVDSGKEIKTLRAPDARVGYLYFSPEGKTLAVGRRDWRVSFIEWQTGKEHEVPLPIVPRAAVQFSMDSTFHGSFSPDGKWFVSQAISLEPLGVFEAATGREVHRFPCPASTSTVSPDSKQLAVSCMQNDKGGPETVLRLFDLASGKEVKQFPLGIEESYFSLAFSPNGKILACGFSDRSCLLDATTGRVLHRLSGRPIGMAFSPDGKTLVASTGHRLRFWDVATGQERHDRPGEFGYNPVLAVSPDGCHLASADWMEQVVSLWDTTSSRLVRRLPLKGQQRYVRNLAFSVDGQTLVASQGMGYLQFWDVVSGNEQRAVQLHDPSQGNRGDAYFYQLRVAPDGKHVTTLERILGQGQSTRLASWETATGKLIRQLALFPQELREGAWASDGSTVAFPLKEGLTVVDANTGVAGFAIPEASGADLLSASPDNRMLAGRRTTVPEKGAPITVVIWESATGKQVTGVAAGRVEHLALTADSRSLVTTDEAFLRVWDLGTSKERQRWPLPVAGTDSWGKTFVFGLLLAPDGRRAFTALADGTALVWDLAPALRPAAPLVKEAGYKDVAAWWTDLAGEDAGRAYAAVWRLAEVPGASVPFLRQHLRPVTDTQLKEIRQHITDLDSDAFAVRQKASQQLKSLGPAAVPALREELKNKVTLEVRRRVEQLLQNLTNRPISGEPLRTLRALAVLEHAGTPEARQLLQELAKGASAAWSTQEAKACLQRLAKRSGSQR